jgi:hypothetical protein
MNINNICSTTIIDMNKMYELRESNTSAKLTFEPINSPSQQPRESNKSANSTFKPINSPSQQRRESNKSANSAFEAINYPNGKPLASQPGTEEDVAFHTLMKEIDQTTQTLMKILDQTQQELESRLEKNVSFTIQRCKERGTVVPQTIIDYFKSMNDESLASYYEYRNESIKKGDQGKFNL